MNFHNIVSLFLLLLLDCGTSFVVPGINAVVDMTSKYQPKVDFGKLKAGGIKGVIHKVTEGMTWHDKKYGERKIEALKNGLLWGAYHFGTKSKTGVDQARNFLKFVGNDKNMLLALDLEVSTVGSMPLKNAEDFVNTIYNVTGRYPLIYGGSYLKDLVRNKKSDLFKCPLWLSQYGTKAVIPKNTWTDWTLWQYTDSTVGPLPHRVVGVDGPCDRDTVNTKLYRSVEMMWKNAGKPA